ncbi:hypothetical protein CLOP_g6835 [Closterium sp. NIES-67]|nr:hypothetical protein CLOP_g6835 [Closterium sp. NIES-67]
MSHCKASDEGSASRASEAAEGPSSPSAAAPAVIAARLGPVTASAPAAAAAQRAPPAARTRQSTVAPLVLTCLTALLIIALAVAGRVAPPGALSAIAWGRSAREGERRGEEMGGVGDRKGEGGETGEGKGESEPIERECSMTYMWPSYVQIPIQNRSLEQQGLDSNPLYSLFLYRESHYMGGGSRMEEVRRGLCGSVPVLFIPGNAGCYKQVRSLASVSHHIYLASHTQDKPRERSPCFLCSEEGGAAESAEGAAAAAAATEALGAREGKQDSQGYPSPLAWFSVDLREHLSALDGSLLRRQAAFVAAAVTEIRSLYRSSCASNLPPPSSVLLVGHSMGGIVARLAERRLRGGEQAERGDKVEECAWEGASRGGEGGKRAEGAEGVGGGGGAEEQEEVLRRRQCMESRQQHAVQTIVTIATPHRQLQHPIAAAAEAAAAPEGAADSAAAAPAAVAAAAAAVAEGAAAAAAAATAAAAAVAAAAASAAAAATAAAAAAEGAAAAAAAAAAAEGAAAAAAAAAYDDAWFERGNTGTPPRWSAMDPRPSLQDVKTLPSFLPSHLQLSSSSSSSVADPITPQELQHLFLRSSPTRFFILVYVDDMILFADDAAAMQQVKDALHARLKCKDLGELKHYLGMTITRDRTSRTITLSQSFYIDQVLQRFDMAQAKPVTTPLQTDHQLAPPPAPSSSDHPYAELVGSLILPPLPLQPSLLSFYRSLNHHSSRSPSSLLLVASLAAGHSDWQVRSWATAVPPSPDATSLHLPFTTSPHVWLSAGHEQAVWCNQPVSQLSHALLSLVNPHTSQPFSSLNTRRGIVSCHLSSAPLVLRPLRQQQQQQQQQQQKQQKQEQQNGDSYRGVHDQATSVQLHGSVPFAHKWASEAQKSFSLRVDLPVN